MHEEVGAVLGRRRRQLGLSLRDVQRLTGVHYSEVSRVERGETRSSRQIKRLATGLGLDPETFAVVADVAAPRRPAVSALGGSLDAVAALTPKLVVDSLLAELFRPDEWSPAAREEAEGLIREELERATAWGKRVREAYAAAHGPMAASAGVPSGEAEERVFLRRMRRALERGGRG